MLAVTLAAVSFHAPSCHVRNANRMAIVMSGPMTSWAVDTPAAAAATVNERWLSNEDLQQAAQPDESFQGVVAPTAAHGAMLDQRPNVWTNPRWEFRHGIGDAALASSPAIDGSVAMRTMHTERSTARASPASVPFAPAPTKEEYRADKRWLGAGGQHPAEQWPFSQATAGQDGGGADAYYMPHCL